MGAATYGRCSHFLLRSTPPTGPVGRNETTEPIGQCRMLAADYGSQRLLVFDLVSAAGRQAARPKPLQKGYEIPVRHSRHRSRRCCRSRAPLSKK